MGNVQIKKPERPELQKYFIQELKQDGFKLKICTQLFNGGVIKGSSIIMNSCRCPIWHVCTH